MSLDEGDEFEARQAAAAAKRGKTKKKEGATKDLIGVGHPMYWEARYREELDEMVGKIDVFDWYCPFEPVWDMISNFIDVHANHKILVVGVGRSNVVECLYKSGYRDITAIDISPTMVKRMQDKYAHLTGVNFLCLDVREMVTLNSDAFSLVIDKACIDAIFTSTDFITSSKRAFNEIYRVLRQDGNFFCVTHATPLSRVPYLRSIEWAIDISKIVEGENLTLFCLTKTTDRAMLDKKIVGAEAAIQRRSSALVSSLDQKMNKSSTNRNKANAGALTVTASVDRMIEMVDESQEVDGDENAAGGAAGGGGSPGKASSPGKDAGGHPPPLEPAGLARKSLTKAIAEHIKSAVATAKTEEASPTPQAKPATGHTKAVVIGNSRQEKNRHGAALKKK